MAAPVFRELSDKLFAIRPDIRMPLPKDTLRSPVPFIQAGLAGELNNAVATLGIGVRNQSGDAEWVKPALDSTGVVLEAENIRRGIMPDVCGMGLKDAVYLLESQGLNVLVKGKGTVVRQSIPAGTTIGRRTPVIIELQTGSLPQNPTKV